MAQDEEYNLGKRRSAFERIIETFNGGRRVRRQKQKNEVGDIPENSILRFACKRAYKIIILAMNIFIYVDLPKRLRYLQQLLLH